PTHRLLSWAQAEVGRERLQEGRLRRVGQSDTRRAGRACGPSPFAADAASGPQRMPSSPGSRAARAAAHVLKWRWLGERTVAWLSTWRRLAKDWEVLPASEPAWISLAMIRLMRRRLAHQSS